MLKKLLFIILILAQSTAFAMKPTVDDVFPESSDDNKSGKQLVKLLRKGIECELFQKGSLDDYATSSQTKEVRSSLPACADLESSTREEIIDLSQARTDYFIEKNELFSDDSFLRKCTDATLERCVTGISSFLYTHENDSSELYDIAQKLTTLLLEKSMFQQETEGDRGIECQLKNARDVLENNKNAATLKLYRFIRLVKFLSRKDPQLLKIPAEENRLSLKVKDPFHFIRAHYNVTKADAFSEDNLKLCHLGYFPEFIGILCDIVPEKTTCPERTSLIQSLVTLFPEVTVADSYNINWTVEYMNQLLNTQSFKTYRTCSYVDFDTWVTYVRSQPNQVAKESKLYDLCDGYYTKADLLSSNSVTRLDELPSSAPSTPVLSKGSPPATRRAKELMSSVKQKLTPQRTSSAGTLQLPRSSTSKSPTSPRKESTSPRTSLSQSLGNVVSRVSGALTISKSSPSSRSPSPRRKKPEMNQEVQEVTPAATAGLRDAGRFSLEKSQDIVEADE